MDFPKHIKHLEEKGNKEAISYSENHTSLEDQEIKDREQNRQERKDYASRAFCFLCVFTFAIILIVIFSGFQFWNFGLSDSVLITLITSSLATIVGIFILVMQYLFKK